MSHLPVATPADLALRLRALGPPPIGNPGAARAYAADLRRSAEALRTVGHLYIRQGVVASFEGAAARRHQQHVERGHTRVQQQAGRLDHLAARVLHEAAALEAAQHAWRKKAHWAASAAPGLLGAALRFLGWRMP